MPARGAGDAGKHSEFNDKDKPSQIRYSNLTAGKGMRKLEKLVYTLLKGLCFDSVV